VEHPLELSESTSPTFNHTLGAVIVAAISSSPNFSGNPVRTEKYLHEWRYEYICKDPVAQNRDPITRVIFNNSRRVVEIENQ
jgi:hypothetical protein